MIGGFAIALSPPHPAFVAGAGFSCSSWRAASRGGRTTVTVLDASAATFAEVLPSSVRASECCRAPMMM
jgi:hypothetical protein